MRPPRWYDRIAFNIGAALGRGTMAGQRLQLDEWRQSRIDRQHGIYHGPTLGERAYYEEGMERDAQQHNENVWLRNDRIQFNQECRYGHPFCRDPRCQ